jgi:hypothetical protein
MDCNLTAPSRFGRTSNPTSSRPSSPPPSTWLQNDVTAQYPLLTGTKLLDSFHRRRISRSNASSFSTWAKAQLPLQKNFHTLTLARECFGSRTQSVTSGTDKSRKFKKCGADKTSIRISATLTISIWSLTKRASISPSKTADQSSL